MILLSSVAVSISESGSVSIHVIAWRHQNKRSSCRAVWLKGHSGGS